RGDLAPWLYEVARRVSAHARAAAARRRKHEQRAAVSASGVASAPGDGVAPDVAALVHDAVGRLPERFRAAVVLCDLEGLSYREAAGRLGWTAAAVRNRLARGRQRLRAALTRAGVAHTAVAMVGSG